MASVLPPPSAAKLDATLEQELGKATGRIRLNDILAGGLSLAVLTLAFAATAILLDRWLELPEWVRQALLGGFVLTFALVGYLLLLRPFRRAVNPRFAARRVEETVPEAKNALINWVDLRDRELPAGVRAAVNTKAVEGVAGADVNKAVESKRVVWLAAAAGLLLAVLAGLFVVFKPAPFLSLVSRTFNPFTATRIASRTELSIQEPQGGDVTVTAGDPVTVRVYVGGSIPDPDGPDRVRLRVRYNPAVPEYDELPLDPGGSARDWILRVPQSVVQNGFWYTVAGGDAETTEYRVTVRSRPLFKEFEARYVYPAYTRLKPEVARGPALWGYRGTEVMLTTTTNRRVKRGWLQMDGQSDTIPGQVVGEARDSLQFKLTLARAGTYQLGFTSADDEPGEPTPQYPIKLAEDRNPWPQITAPVEDDVALAADALLAVDGTLEDDFGLTSAALAMRVLGEDAKVLHDLKPKPYRDGKPFRRESDGTFPTKMTYKDSVSLASLVDANGRQVELTEKMVLEYWLEATDNCTEPKPNVGKSAVKRVRVVPPPPEPEKQQQQKQAQQQRGAEEQKHQQQQDQQLQGEKREPPPQLRPEEQPNPEPKEGEPGSEGSQPGSKTEEPKKPNESDPKGSEKPEPKQGGKGADPAQPKAPQKDTSAEPMGQPNDPPTMPETSAQPRETGPQPMGDPPPKQGSQPQDGKQAPREGTPPPQNDPDQVEQQAQDVQKAIEQQNRQPGEGRNQDPDQAKPAEAPADKKPAAEPPPGGQAEQKAGQPIDPQGQPAGEPSGQSKPQGGLEQPKPADTKPEPKPTDGSPHEPKNQQASPGSEAAGDTPKPPPVAGNTPAQERPQPKPGNTDPKQSKEQTQSEKKSGDMKPTDSSAARGNETPPQGQPEQGQPAGETKPKPETTRGQERPKDGTGAGQPTPEERPAEARGPKPTDPGSSKQSPTGTEPGKTPEAGEKPQPGTEGSDPKDPRKSPADAKPEGTKPQPGANANDSKTQPKAGQQEKAAEKSAQPKGSGQGEKKVDPKEIEQATRDLASGDPQKQQAARDKLDKLMGKKAREKAEHDAKQLQDDLNSNDPARRQAAEQKLKDLAEQAERQAGQGSKGTPLSDAEKQKLKEMAKDLTSGDPAKREAAEKEFDDAIGQERRKQLQQMAKDTQSGDPKKQEAALQKLDEMMKNAGQGAEGQRPSPEELQKWADKAKDLNSPEPGKREAAEKEFDDKFGKGAREQLQKDMRDPKKSEEARKKFEEMAKNFNKDWRPGGGAGRGQKGSLHKEDPRNRLKTAELQLQQFEKNRENKDLQNKLGYTREEYDQFLKSYQQRVAQMREEVAKQEQAGTEPIPTGPAPLRVGEGSDGRKAVTRPDGTAGTTGGAGPGTAPPGYSDAQRKFAEEAAKLRKGQDKQ